MDDPSHRGILMAGGTYLCWGLLPVFWKLLQPVPALQVIGHRVVWSFLLIVFFLWLLRRSAFSNFTQLTARILGLYAVAALLLSGNWLLFVWAVNAGFLIEASLGSFIGPLVSVALAVVFLKESLRGWQWISLTLAALGVVYMTVAYGAPPWIALTLAISFSMYSLLKKMAPLDPLLGLAVETGLLLLPAIGYLLYCEILGKGAFLHVGAALDGLIVATGLVTTLPLLMFTLAVRSASLALVGVLQYISPTIQFLLGAIVYGEPFGRTQLIGFSAIWLALLLYATGGLWSCRRRRKSDFALSLLKHD